MANLLYQELTYKIRGAIFNVHKALGSGHKESVYRKALAEEFKKQAITFIEEKSIPIEYNGTKVGVYRPDLIVDDKVIIEIKAVSFLAKNSLEQMKHYLCGSDYRLGLLVNFGTRKADIRRIIYDKVRQN
jgi:GxxExxY protein